MSRGTKPLETENYGLPVRTLRVEVIEGADRGRIATTRSESLTVGSADGNDLVLSDPTVSRYHVEFERAGRAVCVIDHGSTNGTSVGGARIERGWIAPGTDLRVGRTRIRVHDGESITVALHPGETLGTLLGRSNAMRRLMARVAKASASDVPVLLVGESGTGKEKIARGLHDLSDRHEAAFEVVDCASLAPSLIATELFGHERGAFTGAERQHIGAFERAHGGTLFLDEIGELPPELQASLLGALERRRFRRVGGRDEVEVDVRVVAATHRDLRAEINAGRFRLDLYYRLAVLVLKVPPLRERAEDIPLLVAHFSEGLGLDGSARDELFPPEVLDALARHHWPGNVRELRNVVEATIALGETSAPDAGIMPARDDPFDPDAIPLGRILALPYKEARDAVLQRFERRYVERALERHEGNVTHASRAAQMDRSHLSSLIKKHGLKD